MRGYLTVLFSIFAGSPTGGPCVLTFVGKKNIITRHPYPRSLGPNEFQVILSMKEQKHRFSIVHKIDLRSSMIDLR